MGSNIGYSMKSVSLEQPMGNLVSDKRYIEQAAGVLHVRILNILAHCWWNGVSVGSRSLPQACRSHPHNAIGVVELAIPA